MKLLKLSLLVILLSGCVSTPELIVETPTERTSLSLHLTKSASFVDHLKGAQSNLQQAQAIGVLRENDPALACVTQVLAKIAPETGDAPKSFVPNSGSILEDASIAYILKRQLEDLRNLGPSQPDPTCLGLVGQIVYDGAVAARRGLSVLNPIRGLR